MTKETHHQANGKPGVNRAERRRRRAQRQDLFGVEKDLGEPGQLEQQGALVGGGQVERVGHGQVGAGF